MHDSCAFFILHIVVNKHGEGPALFILEKKGCKALDETQGEYLELTVHHVNGKDKIQTRKTNAEEETEVPGESLARQISGPGKLQAHQVTLPH